MPKQFTEIKETLIYQIIILIFKPISILFAVTDSN